MAKSKLVREDKKPNVLERTMDVMIKIIEYCEVPASLFVSGVGTTEAVHYLYQGNIKEGIITGALSLGWGLYGIRKYNDIRKSKDLSDQ